MKGFDFVKKVFALIMTLAILSATFTGCKKVPYKPEIQEIDYNLIYTPVIEKYCDVIGEIVETNEIPFETEDGFMGIYETALWLKEDTFDEIGYVIEDISGDGVPELIIGCAEKEEWAYTKNDIFAVYTVKDEAPLFVLEGRSRSAFSLMEGNSLFHTGSSGAAYSIFGEYYLSDDGAELICKDYYFTAEEDGDYTKIAFYHNETGEWDVGSSEKFDSGEEEFWAKQNSYSDRTVEVAFIPLSEVKGNDDEEQCATVTADFAENVDLTEYDEFVADDGEMQNRIVFFSDGKAENFKFIGLTFKDMTEEGKIIFEEEILYETESLDKERPLVVKMSFFGTIPSYGISYVSGGEEKRFAVEMSGVDGSIILTEF